MHAASPPGHENVAVVAGGGGEDGVVEGAAEAGAIDRASIQPSPSTSIVSVSTKSRRAVVHSGGSNGNSRNGAPTVPAVRWALASSPIPLPQVWGENVLPAATTSWASRRSPVSAVRAHAVGLEHVEAVAFEELAELVRLAGELAARDPDVDPAAQFGVPVVVAAVQRLLHPVHALGGEVRRRPRWRARRPTAGGVPGHPPALVAVDHQLERIADRVADRPNHGEVVGESRPTEAHLQRRRSPSPTPARATSTISAERPMDTGRGVGADARRVPADQRPHRPVVDLAGEIPQGDVQRPRPAGVELDVGEHRRVAVEVERVLADEVALEVGEAVHRVAGADADVAGVVVDPHDRRREVGARPRVPRRGERWIERRVGGG